MMEYKELNGNALKIIAMISMLIDHTGLILIGYGLLPKLVPGSSSYDWWWNLYTLCRTLGRLAFPIFCFLLVEGFLHTHDRKAYAVRLFGFALISEVPFNLAIAGQVLCPKAQNVMFTLLLGLLALSGIELVQKHFPYGPDPGARMKTLVPSFAVIIVCCVVAILMKTDYTAGGVMLIVILYWYRMDAKWRLLIGALWMVLQVEKIPLMIGIVAGFALLALYNGERGRWKLKLTWYWFYPVHMLLLFGIRCVLFGA